MTTYRVKTTLTYVLTQNRENGTAILDLFLQPMDDTWVDILVQDAHQSNINTYVFCNPIEPKWVHGKRNVVETNGLLTARQLDKRVCAYYGTSSEPHLFIPEKVA